MFNASEVMTVIARHRQALSLAGLLAGFAASGQLTALGAQTNRQGEQPAARLLVGPLKSTDKKLGTDAAEAIRSRISSEIPLKQLWVIPKNDITSTLQGSGFPPDEALGPNDARELARSVRADTYVEGTAAKTDKGVRLDTRMVLSRDNALTQPLGPAEAGNVNSAASQVAKEYKAAIKQLDAEQKCVGLFRQQKYQEAVAAAREGVAAYPRATIARACIANAYSAMKLPPDSTISIAQQILQIDPTNKTALGLIAPAYQAKGDTAKAIDAWTMLVSTEPGNTRVVEPVVSAIAASGQAARAVPIINKAVTENPGDPRLLDLQFRLLRAAKDWKGAIRAGEDMVRTDTSLADTAYFLRIADAYASDSQPQKASEAISRGVAKFPNNSDLHLYQVQLLRGAGQTQQAAQSLHQLIAANPKTPGAYLQLAQIQGEMNQPDSALASLHLARQNGDSANLVGQAALVMGNKARTAAQSAPDFQNALRLLAFADSNLTNPQQKAQAEFVMGVTQLSLGQQALKSAQASKSCTDVKVAKDAFTEAQINLPKGGAFSPDAAKQALGALQQLSPYADQMAKAYKCRS
jgi:tetratricopeptide (TPR) repeat protein